MSETVTEEQIVDAWKAIAASPAWKYARLVLIGEMLKPPGPDLSSGAVIYATGRRSFCHELLEVTREAASVHGSVEFPDVNILRKRSGPVAGTVGAGRRVQPDRDGYPDAGG